MNESAALYIAICAAAIAVYAALIATCHALIDFARFMREVPDIKVSVLPPESYPPTISGSQEQSMFSIRQDVVLLNDGRHKVTIFDGEAEFEIGNMKELGPNLFTYKRDVGRDTGFASDAFPLALDGGEARTVGLVFTFEASPYLDFDGDWYKGMVIVRLNTTAGKRTRRCEFAVKGYDLRNHLRRRPFKRTP